MKAVAVRELRNRQTTLLGWVAAGDEVMITKRRKSGVRLLPEVEEIAATPS